MSVEALSDEGFDGRRRLVNEALINIVSPPAHENPQLLVVCFLWVGAAAQPQDVFNEARGCFIGALG